MREICLDTETTGLDPASGHRIIEIGAIELTNKIKTGHYHIYLNPEREVPQEAFAIHGISSDFLRDKPKFKEVANDFINFIGGAKLVIHNAGFDMKFINHELRNCGMEIIKREMVIDTLEIARSKFPGAGNSLDALCKRFKINLARKKHGALLDAELLHYVYVELMGGNQASIFDCGVAFVENKSQNNLLNQNKNQDQKINQRPKLESRNFSLSDEEIQAHREFITKNFKKNFWQY